MTCLPEPITVDHSLIWLHKHATNFAQVYTDQQTRNVRIWIRVLISRNSVIWFQTSIWRKLGGFEVNSEKVGQLLKHDFVLGWRTYIDRKSNSRYILVFIAHHTPKQLVQVKLPSNLASLSNVSSSQGTFAFFGV